MADAGTITLDVAILPDDIAKTLTDETFVYTPADSTEGWYYKLTVVAGSDGELIARQSYLQKGSGVTGTLVGANMPTVAADDKVKFLFVKNTGFTEDGTTANTTDSIYICFDGGTTTGTLGDAIEIGPGESWYGKFTSLTVENLKCIAAVKAGGGGTIKKVQAIVAAVLDDVG
tara:strand:- start:25992 stop:26510 length:519 start_codon:yes stop_codon:yes gene_type:complete